jgi:glycosyltransferase involved in cell wall biosynthesis
MSNQTITYSIIIPHYNSYGLLRRALNSIPLRDDIETFVIDDLSSEPSIQKISKDQQYTHINFIFSAKKITAGGARNIGLNHACGKYILFSDSDDYFTKDAFQLFDKYVQLDYDLVQFKVTSFLEGQKKIGNRHDYLKKIYQQKGLAKYLSISPPYGKLIKRFFIEEYKIRFSEVCAGNDVYFSAKVALFSEQRSFVAKTVYSVSQNSTSITATKSEKNNCSRLREQINKVQLILCITPVWFWGIYLSRRNILCSTTRHIKNESTTSSELVALSREYQRIMPKPIIAIYKFFKLINRVE